MKPAQNNKIRNFLKKYGLMAIELNSFSRWSWNAVFQTITKYCMDLFLLHNAPPT